jgi:hypothetical protein
LGNGIGFWRGKQNEKEDISETGRISDGAVQTAFG